MYDICAYRGMRAIIKINTGWCDHENTNHGMARKVGGSNPLTACMHHYVRAASRSRPHRITQAPTAAWARSTCYHPYCSLSLSLPS